MTIDSFPEEVMEELKWYVYRLVDPRNGETFYVGKGKENRIFAHLNAQRNRSCEIAEGLKQQRINEIRSTGLDVQPIVHRHGMSSEATAYEVEAALIDAYPGLVNKVAGRGSKDRGTKHAAEIIAEYKAEPFKVGEPLILISIGGLW